MLRDHEAGSQRSLPPCYHSPPHQDEPARHRHPLGFLVQQPVRFARVVRVILRIVEALRRLSESPTPRNLRDR